MRLFQQRTVGHSALSDPNPVPPPIPPFLPVQGEERRRLNLLRESTTHLREGRQRLPTPDRAAIMDLSSSFQKRHLGKQQQILREITQRCREQEVTDLSSRLTAKVQLQRTSEGDEDSVTAAMYHHAVSRMPHMRPRPPHWHVQHGPTTASGAGGGEFREPDSIERRVKSEKDYKFFPARKIIKRQPTRLQLISSTFIRSGGGGGASTATGGWGGGGGAGGGSNTYRDHPFTLLNPLPPATVPGGPGLGSRLNIDFLKGTRPTDPEVRTQLVDRQNMDGSIQLQHFLQPTGDPIMAPLLLPDLHKVGGVSHNSMGGWTRGELGGGGTGEGEEHLSSGYSSYYQARLDSYFSSTRLPLNQRSRSFHNASSVSGRSFRSMFTAPGIRPTGSRHHLRSKKSERSWPRTHVLPAADEDDDDDLNDDKKDNDDDNDDDREDDGDVGGVDLVGGGGGSGGGARGLGVRGVGGGGGACEWGR